MTQIQNMQNEQQQQATYVNPQAMIMQVTLQKELGILQAQIKIHFTAALVKEIAKRKVEIKESKWYGLEFDTPIGYSEVRSKLYDLIEEAAVKKIVQSNKLSDHYTVTLDVADIDFTEIDSLIQKIEEEKRIREEEERKRKEEEKRIREEKLKIVEQIKQKVNELKQQQVVRSEYGDCVTLLNGTEILYDIGYDLEILKKELEKANSIDAYKVLRDVVEELKNENKKLYGEINKLKNIIKKLTSAEELEEKLEELEEDEEEKELTKEEIEYILRNVYYYHI